MQSQNFQSVDIDNGLRAFMQELGAVREVERLVSPLRRELIVEFANDAGSPKAASYGPMTGIGGVSATAASG